MNSILCVLWIISSLFICSSVSQFPFENPCQNGYYYDYLNGVLGCYRYSCEQDHRCASGYWCPSGVGDTNCTLCALGTYASFSNSDCNLAFPGTYAPDPTQTYIPCSIGTYNPNFGSYLSSDCVACTAGHYCPSSGLDVPVDCAAGTYNANTGSSSSSDCTSCGTGTYNSNTGQTSCSKCPPGTYSTATGATSSSTCANCAAGTYNANNGSSSCPNCPSGKFSAAGAYVCSSKCSNGYYNPPSTYACYICPAGTYSKGGDTSCTNCNVGYYSSQGSTTCTMCPSATNTPSNAATSSASCGTCVPSSPQAYTNCIATTTLSAITLRQHETLKSTNGKYQISVQDDGNVVAKENQTSFWSTNTQQPSGSQSCPFILTLQLDGNLVLSNYPFGTSGATRSIWSTSTGAILSTFKFCMRDDRNIVLNQYSSVTGTFIAQLWQSGTTV